MGSTSFLGFSYTNLLLVFSEPLIFRNLYHIFLASVGTFSGSFLFLFLFFCTLFWVSLLLFKENQSTSRPPEHPPVMGKKMSKRLVGGIKGCKYKTSSWHLNRFPDADNIGSTV